jgi:hypothetical protein
MKKITSIMSVVLLLYAISTQASGRDAATILKGKKVACIGQEDVPGRIALLPTQEHWIAAEVGLRGYTSVIEKLLQLAIEQRYERAMNDAAQRHQQRELHAADQEEILDQVLKQGLKKKRNQSAL